MELWKVEKYLETCSNRELYEAEIMVQQAFLDEKISENQTKKLIKRIQDEQKIRKMFNIVK